MNHQGLALVIVLNQILAESCIRVDSIRQGVFRQPDDVYWICWTRDSLIFIVY